MNRASRGEYVNIFVRNARTHIEEGRARFTDYEIEVKTNHMAFTVRHSKVRRRYSDFIWLRSRLAKDLMTSDPPTLPGRRLFGRFTTDFITQRQRRLQEFLAKVVKNNVFLSHAALHLFLQSKMTVSEIEKYIDSKCDDEPYDTILSESAFKVSLHPNQPQFTRDRSPSKQDSGIESCEHDEVDCNSLKCAVQRDRDEDEDSLSDGNTADSEDNAEDASYISEENNNTDEDQLDISMRELRLTSLPSEKPGINGEMESSVEFVLAVSSDSEGDVIAENEVQTSSHSNASPSKGSPARSRSRSRRRRRTCIPKFDLAETVKDTKETESFSKQIADKMAPIRRCFSFDVSAKSFSMFQAKMANIFGSPKPKKKSNNCEPTRKRPLYRSHSVRLCGSGDKLRISSFDERSKPTVKRTISLNEYCILKGNDFNLSL